MIKHLFIKTLAGAGLLAAVIAGSAAFSAQASAKGEPGKSGTTGTAILLDSTTPASTTTTPGLSDPERWPAWVQGRPTKLDDGSARGWYFWHDASGLHLDTTTPQDRNHAFEAVLTTAGTFYDIDKIHLESGDDVQLLDHGHRLVVKFHTYSGIDGVNFHIAGGDSVRLRLEEGGHLIDRSNIFVGHFNVHPATDPFTIHR